MDRPFLTIAIPTVNDFRGLWPTVQSLFLHHGDQLPQCEILVVDQEPDSEDGQAVKRHIAQSIRQHRHDGRLFSNKYVPDYGTRGVGPVRNKCFEHATGDFVLVIDSHILLGPGALKSLIEYFDSHLSTGDLITGPLVSDGGAKVRPSQDLRWRKHALGTWHEVGIDQFDFDGEPFEIPMQGLGLFACRRDAFPGFDKRQSGFGCGEAVFCQSFRDRGDRVLCLPSLTWAHRFVDIGEPRHKPYLVDRVANYMFEFQRAGMDPSGMIEHFVDVMSEADKHELYLRMNRNSDWDKDENRRHRA